MKSLRRRLFGLPIVIVVIVSVAVMLLFNIVVSGYVDNQVEQSMNSFREYHVAMDNLQEKIDKIQSKNNSSDSDLSKSEAEMICSQIVLTAAAMRLQHRWWCLMMQSILTIMPPT